MAFTQESISKVLRDINANMPPLLKEHAFGKISLTPTIQKVMEEALNSPNISEAKKIEVRRLRDAGYFNREKVTENPKYVKMIDEWTTRQIKKAVKAGRLPNKEQLAKLEIIWKKEKEEKKS